MPEPVKKLRIEAPKGMHALDIAQEIIKPYQLLLKAEQVKYSERTFSRYKAMREMSAQFESNYRKQLDKLVKTIRAYVEKKIIYTSLEKADNTYKPLITPEQLHEVQQLIRDYHLAFVAGQVGPQYINSADIQRLIDAGILPQDLGYSYQPAPGEVPPETAKFISDAYYYGIMMGSVPLVRAQANEMSAVDFRKRKRPKLSPQETAARDYVQRHATEHIKGLGNTVASDFTTIAIEGDAELKAKFQQAIKEEIDINIAHRDQWRKAASEMGHKTGDWARGFKRIAATEKQGAFQEGLSAGLIEKEGDPETVYVAKQPAPDACPDCVRLHLTAGPGSPPKIFKLSTLMENGTNVGKRRTEWRAVVGVIHPWCHPAGHRVKTKRGELPIEQVRIGDLVWTHLARWRCVQRLSKRFYGGDIIKLVIGNKTLKSTPEHAALTPLGWREVRLFQQGEYALCDPFVIRSGSDNQPAYFTEVSCFRGVLTLLSGRIVPIAGVDFNSNKVGRKAEIDVVRPESHLGDAAVVNFCEEGMYSHFVRSHVPAFLVSYCTFDFLNEWTRLSASRFVGSLRNALSFFCRTFGIYQLPLLAKGTNANAVFLQTSSDCTPVNSIFVGEENNAFATGVTSDNYSDGEFDSFGHNDVAYHGAAVKSTRRVPFEGYVYNLAVEDDESYVCEGVVSHNCGCEMVHVPPGWEFDDEGNMVPKELKRSDYLSYDLRKAQGNLTYKHVVPEKGCSIRVGDPVKVKLIEKVIEQTPKELFDKKIGVTLITEDHPRVQNPMDDHDLAYWTGNEIRLAIQLKPERLPHVLRHELSHGLNVYLMYRWGGTEPVKKWHKKLYRVSRREGFVSAYAKLLPIENAAEATRFYLYDRKKLMLNFPSTFAMLHNAYRDIWK